MKDFRITSNIAFDCLREDLKAKLIDGKQLNCEIAGLEYLCFIERVQYRFVIIKLVKVCEIYFIDCQLYSIPLRDCLNIVAKEYAQHCWVSPCG